MAWLGLRSAMAQVSPHGMRVLAREKSLAEQFLTLLDEFGRKDVQQYATGVTLYVAAKAEFDGLISELEHSLEQGSPPDQSAIFQAELDNAVDKRIAFTNFVEKTILPRSGGATKSVGDFIRVIPELITALTQASISIWREFRSSGEARRQAIKQELEALRWSPFRA